VTETTKSGFKSAAELPDDLHSYLGILLLSLADNKRILGIRYSDWILGAPSVEAGIACSAMAQDEWGHGRIIYSMLKDFGHDPAALEHERTSEEYRSSELLDCDVSSWPELLALNFLWDTAISVQVEMLVESCFEPIHYKVRKLLEEERFHFDHGSGWTSRLMTSNEGKDALGKAFAAAWNACLRWFGPENDPLIEALVEGGIVSTGADCARTRWLNRVGPTVGDLGLVYTEKSEWVSEPVPDWNGWSPVRRRASEGGPDADSLARARGDRNRSLL